MGQMPLWTFVDPPANDQRLKDLGRRCIVCKWLSKSYASGKCDCRLLTKCNAFTLKAPSRTAIGHPGRHSIGTHACTLYTLVTNTEPLLAYPHLLPDRGVRSPR
jgi:hypothetical protein